MIPGRMNRKIIIQEWTDDSPAISSYGEPSGSWTTFATMWAEKLDQRGREFFSSGVTHEGTTIFRIWFIDDITAKMRISYDGDIYDIKSIVEIGVREGLEIIATVQP